MKPPSQRRRLGLLFLCVFSLGVVACGKKGPPLAPLARVPAAPANVQAIRVGDEVFVSFTVPAANTSGQAPADMDAVDLYAFTGAMAPPGPDPTQYARKIGTYAVVPALPPAPAPPEGAPAPPPAAPRAFVQGETAVVTETLGPEAMAPTPVTAADMRAAAAPEAPRAEGPLVASLSGSGLSRYYFLVASGQRRRASVPSALVTVPIDPGSGAPQKVEVSYTADAIVLQWAPPADARLAQPAPADATLLPAKPLVASPPATTYHVFEVPRGAPAEPDIYQRSRPVPLTQAPVATPQASIAGTVAFNVERCFVVRPIDTINGAVVAGTASEPACVTPVDRFPPAPPQNLAAIAGVGVINLIWEPNAEPDLAGYVVLRGTAPGDTLQALTPSPIRETTYRDESVRPGERYVYAVVAVDNATPQNVSGQSNRVEESPRAPR